MKKVVSVMCMFFITSFFVLITSCQSTTKKNLGVVVMSKTSFHDKMKGAWSGQVIGVTYGFPVEFKYNSTRVPDSVKLVWNDSLLYNTYIKSPGAYDDIYVDLTFLEVYKQNSNATNLEYAKAFSSTSYDLWFANQVARNNIRNGILPPQSGHWKNNPECTSIDFQIEADFIGLLYPGKHKEALELADKVGHIMSYGDGYYGGVFVSQMYASALISNNIEEIISKGLASIPVESLFHKMITDVMTFHKKNPNNWKACWEFINTKYQDENGSPFGANDPWNIEASMNSCHVVTGLLYGKNDFLKSMEIATRCGNDADCNPGTVAGILGAMNGYSWIPERFKKPLDLVRGLKFQNSNYTLEEAIEVTEDLALQHLIVEGDQLQFHINKAPMCSLEIARPKNHIKQRVNFKEPIDLFQTDFLSEFKGNGIVVFGKINSNKTGNDYIFEKDTAVVNIYIDKNFHKEIAYPVSFENRKFITYSNFDLPEGKHTIEMKAINPLKGYSFDVFMQVEYSINIEN